MDRAHPRRWHLHRWLVVGMAAVAVLSLAAWWTTRDPLPRRAVLATAHGTGLYQKLGEAIAERYTARTGRALECRTTAGSEENLRLLRDGEVDLAILQATTLEGRNGDVAVLAPLHREPMFVIVRADSSIASIFDLVGRAVALGEPGSGMRVSASLLLRHYRIDPTELARHDATFEELATDPALEAAIVTTGLDNPGLAALLEGEGLRLVGIEDTAALDLSHPTLEAFEVPRGLFRERPALPAAPLATVATTAVLAAREDCSPRLVREALEALYDRDLRGRFPYVIPRADALALSPVPIHAEAQRVLDPYGELQVLATWIESLSGLKELAVGFFALCFLAGDQARRLARRRHERTIVELKDHLDEYLERTIRIERAQLDSEDPEVLREHLRELTRVKLAALEELTTEELRADRSFQIFLMQCANLSRKLQARMSYLQAERLGGAREE